MMRYIKLPVIRRCSRTLTTNVERNADQDDHSILQWLTSPTSNPPPPITTRLTFSIKSTPILTTQHSPKSQPTHHTLSITQLRTYSNALLSPKTLLRSPHSLPPLTIEYSSPNIAKPLHMGHLRSTLTGSYVRNIAEFAGHECRSICFLGDWGRQFGVLHAGVIEETGDADFTTYVDNLTLNRLLTIYVKSSERCNHDPEFASKALSLSAELECTFEQESKAKHLWRHTKNITVDHLRSCYDILGTQFDEFEGESSYSRHSPHTKSSLELLQSKNLTYIHVDGTLRVTGDHILLKRDDSSVYLLRDIACALQRLSRPDHRFVYVVDQGQSSHFKNLFYILRQLGVSKDPQDNPPFSSTHTHIPFGKVTGMSTRQGTFTLLSEVIDQGTTLMHESRKKSRNARNTEDITVSQKLAVSGLVVNALKVRRTKTYAFDWNEALRSNGNSGVSLQYTIARLGSLVRRITGDDEVEVEDDVQKHVHVLFESGRGEVIELIVCLMNFEDTIWKSYTTLEPCILIAYSFNLTDKISRSLSTLNILNEKNQNLANAALWLFSTSRKTLISCMSVLGIQPVGEF